VSPIYTFSLLRYYAPRVVLALALVLVAFVVILWVGAVVR